MSGLKLNSISGRSEFLYNPWFYFLLFTATNSVLSYSLLDFKAKLAVAMVGWALPMAWGLFTYSKRKPETRPLYLEETFEPLPSRWLILAILLSFIPRLYILLNFTWPAPDDGYDAFTSLELSNKWEWYFHFARSQTPPLFNWSSTLFFKFLMPSLFSIRLFAFLLSILTPVLGYFATRHFFSKSVFVLCFLFFSFGFWPLYSSRFFMALPLPILPFEIMAFGALGMFLNSTSPKSLSANGWWLGTVIGLGFWLVIQWPVAAFMIFVAVLYKFKKKAFLSLGLWLPFLLLCVSFWAVSWVSGNGEHAKLLLQLPSQGEWLGRLNDSFSNWTALFWGCDTQNSYGPVWGGMLDPVCGSLFFIGFFELVRHWKFPLVLWVLTAFLAFMAPGLATVAFDIFRDSLVLPLLLLICALGFQSLLTHVPIKRRLFCTAAIFLIVAPLDFTHLLKTFSPAAAQTNGRAFLLLDKMRKHSGPGLIFLDLEPNTEDPRLAVAVYPFNASQNPKLDPSQCRWAAVIENVNYESFLAGRFPDGRWIPIGPDSFWNEGSLMLGIIPVEASNRAGLAQWLEMDRQLHGITRQIHFDNDGSRQETILKQLLEKEVFARGDPFLESAFYEHVLFYERKRARMPELLGWIQAAIKKGYPLPHLLVPDGIYLLTLGKNQAARAAFEKALQAPFNMTNAAENLQIMDAVEKDKHVKKTLKGL
jgi:hypothetical protein